MTEKVGQQIYKTTRPNGMDLYFILLIISLLSILINFVYLSDSYNAIFVLGIITTICGILYGFLGVLLNKNTEIFDNGVVPSYSGFNDFMRSIKLFIPFNKIKLIGKTSDNRDKVPIYYFLMSDGTIKQCNIYFTGDKAQALLAEQLRLRCPNIKIIRIRFNFFDEGAAPREMPEIMKRIETRIKS